MQERQLVVAGELGSLVTSAARRVIGQTIALVRVVYGQAAVGEEAGRINRASSADSRDIGPTRALAEGIRLGSEVVAAVRSSPSIAALQVGSILGEYNRCCCRLTGRMLQVRRDRPFRESVHERGRRARPACAEEYARRWQDVLQL